MVFTKHQEVEVTFEDGHTELGVVVYQRMAPPDYTEAQAVSVKLNSKCNKFGYEGTMFLVSDIKGTK